METKKRKHIIADKAPEVVAIVLMIVGMVIPSAIANPIAEALGGSETPAGQISRGVIAILVSLIMMAVYILWFKPEFKGNLGKEGLAPGCPCRRAVWRDLYIMWKTLAGYNRAWPV